MRARTRRGGGGTVTSSSGVWWLTAENQLQLRVNNRPLYVDGPGRVIRCLLWRSVSRCRRRARTAHDSANDPTPPTPVRCLFQRYLVLSVRPGLPVAHRILCIRRYRSESSRCALHPALHTTAGSQLTISPRHVLPILCSFRRQNASLPIPRQASLPHHMKTTSGTST